MNTHKCQLKKDKNYQVKQRYIPTFAHQPIFQQQPLRPQSSRCTPTFHSTVLDTQGYNIKTIHQKKQKNIETKPQQNQIKTQRRGQSNVQQKVLTLNQSYVIGISRDNWFDHTKQRMLGSIQNGQNRQYSKERKYIDMSSDPVFTDYNYENKNIRNVKIQPKKLTLTTNFTSQSPQNIQKPLLVDQNVQTVQYNNVQQADDNVPKEVKKQSQVEQNVSGINNTTNKNVKFTKTQNEQKQQLKLKGKKVNQRPLTANKQRLVQQKPKFTVIRKSRVHN